MKILVIGHAAYDITFPMEEFPIENTKNRVKNRVECGGGPAFNAAYLLGKWGMDVSFAGVIGNDIYGDKLCQQLKSVGVETTYVQKSNEYKTTNSLIIANTTDGSRTILTYREEKMQMADFEISFDPDVILIDGQEYDLSMKFLKKYPNAISIIDAGRPTKDIIELSTHVNYLVCSKDFAESVVDFKIQDQTSMIQAYRKMKTKFNNNLVITLESAGAMYKYNNQIKLMPSLKVNALDSTGAGDIFHGAFTYAIANNYSLEDAVKIGNIAGAISVTRIGSRNSMPSKDEMKEYFNEFK